MFKRKHELKERAAQLDKEAKKTEEQKSHVASQGRLIDRVAGTLIEYHGENHFTEYVLGMIRSR